MEADLTAGLTEDQLADEARQAAASGALEKALVLWKQLIGRNSELALAYDGAGQTLRDLGRLDEADILLQSALQKFPSNPHLRSTYAWVAGHKGDWREAEQQFRLVEALNPTVGGRFCIGVALEKQGRLADVEVAFTEDDLRNSSPISQLYARNAWRMGKADLAAERWREVLARFPNDLSSYVEFSDLLRQSNKPDESQEVLRQAIEAFADEPRLYIAQAELAQSAGRLSEALDCWEVVKNRYPALVEGYLGAALTLMAMQRYSAAQTAVAPVIRIFPTFFVLRSIYAQAAMHLGHWEDAMHRWVGLQEAAPDSTEGFLGEISAVLAAGDFNRAEAAIDKARALFPTDLNVAMEYAGLPQRQGNWAEARRRWAELVETFPLSRHAKTGLVRALIENGELNDAERLVEAYTKSSHDDLDFARLSADLYARRGEASRALDLWRALYQDHTDDLAVFRGYLDLLKKQGRYDDAEIAIDGAGVDLKSSVHFLVECAIFRTHQRDWTRALPLWAEVRKRAPSDLGVLGQVGSAAITFGQDQPEAPIPDALKIEEPDNPDDIKQLMLRFESLGDDCEFGIIQRNFGAEPLGLMRWAGSAPLDCAAAIRSRFEDFGDPAHTIIEAKEHEFMVMFPRYNIFSHTFTPPSVMSLEKYMPAHMKRLTFLRNKLLQDMQEGEKILVYGSRVLNDEHIEALFSAVRQISAKARLLCVRLADETYAAGEVTSHQDGLMVGAVTEFSTLNPRFEEWLNVCKAAGAQWLN